MSIPKNGYYYNQQLKTYIRQFMAVFAGLQVQVGKTSTADERLISVPITYAHKDRVAASIYAGNTQNKPLRLPVMSAYLSSYSINTDRSHGISVERRTAYVPLGGLVPTDIKVIHQRMPVPYDLEMELTIYASNTDQHFQMIEQIAPLFDPSLTLQTSDAVFDWTRLSTIKLERVQNDSTNPIGSDRRIIQSTFTFLMPIWIDTPADIRADFIERIFLRVGAVTSGADTSEKIVADLDAQNIPYELYQDVSDYDI